MAQRLVAVTGLYVENFLNRVETMRGFQRHRSRRIRLVLACGHERIVGFRKATRAIKRTHCEKCGAQ